MLSLWAGALSVAVPWVVLSSFLLTEVVAYPAFCWALLAMMHAVERKTWQSDLLAFVAIAVAVLARTQFVVLLGVLVRRGRRRGDAGREGARSGRRALAAAAALSSCSTRLLLAVLGAIAIGNGSRLLGSYSVTAENVRIDFGLFQLTFEHVALLALGLAILPFIVGLGWLVDRVRPSTPEPERAFALVGCHVRCCSPLQVASFNQRFGAGLVKDRYLFYVVPIVIVALAAAIGSRQWPRWWALVVPTAVAAVGFASARSPIREAERRHAGRDAERRAARPCDLDALGARPTRARRRSCSRLSCSRGRFCPGGRARRSPPSRRSPCRSRRPTRSTASSRVNGTNGLPITLDQGVVFSWIDRNVGPTGRVTVIKYPVGGADWWAGQGYWWDVEFWNESAVQTTADMSLQTRSTGRDLRSADRRSAGCAARPSSRSSTAPTFAFASPARRAFFDRDAYLVRDGATVARDLAHG